MSATETLAETLKAARELIARAHQRSPRDSANFFLAEALLRHNRVLTALLKTMQGDVVAGAEVTEKWGEHGDQGGRQ